MRLRNKMRWLGAAALPLVLALTGATVAATAVTSTVLTGVAQASDVGGQISRDEVIQRARFWLNKGLQYDQGGSAPDSSGKQYRTDCSGYVSMALHLTNSPNSTAMLTDSRFFTINRADLKPGDFLVLNGHAFLFGGYHADGVHFTFFTFGSTPVRESVGTFTGSSLDGHPTSQYVPRRYKNIVESAPPKSRAAKYSSDFNGNGNSDYATYNASDGSFHVLFDTGGAAYNPEWRLGQAGDLPITGDWNGNGSSDYGVYRPSDGSFHILFDSGGLYEPTWRLGGPGYVPVAGDWNGNGNSDYGVYNPADGSFHILFDSGGLYEPSWRLGGPGDLPVAGDWNGNGNSDYGVYRPSDGSFHVLFDTGGAAYHPEWRLGGSGSIPVSGDWNGNGNSDYGVYNPADGSFHVLFDSGGLYEPTWRLGGSGHRPV
ncbi:hypothetical protein [Lentzea sp. NPDC092896]|uniref:hypothetical protein n=1 Tax=Lentzea sp. NPDC092896 TaxID=3364127 RepID=UPI0037F53066